MPQIILKENRMLSLDNVFMFTKQAVRIDELDAVVLEFQELLQNMKITTYGDIVLKTCGTKMTDTGTVITDCELMAQCVDPHTPDVLQKMNVSPCLYVRYQGHPEYIHYVYQKLELFTFEHEIITNGVIYTIVSKQKNDEVICELYQEVGMV